MAKGYSIFLVIFCFSTIGQDERKIPSLHLFKKNKKVTEELLIAKAETKAEYSLQKHTSA